MNANASIESLTREGCAWVFSHQFLKRDGMLDSMIQLRLNEAHPFTIKGFKAQRAAMKSFDSSAWAHKITRPCLVIGSTEDLVFLEASVKALAAQIPHARYHCFTHCGHLPYLEYPQEFAQVIKQFIKTTCSLTS